MRCDMDSVNKTLYIPLYGKAYVSRKGILLHDPKAEEIWGAEGFPLKGKSHSKWLAYYMGIRAAVFDNWLKAQMASDPDAVILHIGCGMDNRIGRVGTGKGLWFDIDFPEVIAQRKRHFSESVSYKMLGADVRNPDWLVSIPKGNAIVIMEGVSMYMKPAERQQLLEQLCGHFSDVSVLVDCYTEFAAKASRVRNPINDVGVTTVYGVQDPMLLQTQRLRFVAEHSMTPVEKINELQGMERRIFKALYAGKIAEKMYRLYEYRTNE